MIDKSMKYAGTGKAQMTQNGWIKPIEPARKNNSSGCASVLAGISILLASTLIYLGYFLH